MTTYNQPLAEYPFVEMIGLIKPMVADQENTSRKSMNESTNEKSSDENEKGSKFYSWDDPALENLTHALYEQENLQANERNFSKRKCFNCSEEGCSFSRCHEPFNANEIETNQDEFKRSKPWT